MTREELDELATLVCQKLTDEVTEKLALTQKATLTADEAAAYLGIKKSYLYKLTHYRGIPHSKPSGKNCYFSRRELDEWMMSMPVKTSEQLTAIAVERCRLNPMPTGYHTRGKSARARTRQTTENQ